MREKIYNKITNFIADILNSPLDYDILITDDILMLFSIELMKYIDNNDFDFNIVKKIFDGLVRNHNTDILYKLKYIFLDIITNFEPHLIFDKLYSLTNYYLLNDLIKSDYIFNILDIIATNYNNKTDTNELALNSMQKFFDNILTKYINQSLILINNIISHLSLVERLVDKPLIMHYKYMLNIITVHVYIYKDTFLNNPYSITCFVSDLLKLLRVKNTDYSDINLDTLYNVFKTGCKNYDIFNNNSDYTKLFNDCYFQYMFYLNNSINTNLVFDIIKCSNNLQLTMNLIPYCMTNEKLNKHERFDLIYNYAMFREIPTRQPINFHIYLLDYLTNSDFMLWGTCLEIFSIIKIFTQVLQYKLKNFSNTLFDPLFELELMSNTNYDTTIDLIFTCDYDYNDLVYLCLDYSAKIQIKMTQLLEDDEYDNSYRHSNYYNLVRSCENLLLLLQNCEIKERYLIYKFNLLLTELVELFNKLTSRYKSTITEYIYNLVIYYTNKINKDNYYPYGIDKNEILNYVNQHEYIHCITSKWSEINNKIDLCINEYNKMSTEIEDPIFGTNVLDKAILKNSDMIFDKTALSLYIRDNSKNPLTREYMSFSEFIEYNNINL